MNSEQTILVVDDDADFAETLVLQLSTSGHLAISAGSVQQALDTLDEDPTVGLVVSDIRMPGVDGLDFRRVLRHRYPTMPVILMTGLPLDEEERSSARAPILHKPFPIAALIAALAQEQ